MRTAIATVCAFFVLASPSYAEGVSATDVLHWLRHTARKNDQAKPRINPEPVAVPRVRPKEAK